ncbi:MAG: TFIIB-type zinc ribbon-containing protein [Natrialbaceae archaeon]|nr:TFIIB-type zinc ribbon-containing protein [Natrialbaceae archaeon]
MEVRGQRECSECGTQWSYFETGSRSCPNCGSPRSVGHGEPAPHTDSVTALELEDVAESIDAQPLTDTARQVANRCRTYVNDRGFIEEGSLRDLDDTYLSAWELRHLVTELRTLSDADPSTEEYFVTLLATTIRDERPTAEAVPPAAAAARGRGYADAVDRYRHELRRWQPTDRDRGGAAELERLRAIVRSIQAVDGAVEPALAETLVSVTRGLAASLRDPTEPRAPVREQLDELEHR